MKSKWENNSIQFPRLIAEINGIVDISKKEWRSLCESMDLTSDEVEELFERAQIQWQKIKKHSIKGR